MTGCLGALQLVRVSRWGFAVATVIAAMLGLAPGCSSKTTNTNSAVGGTSGAGGAGGTAAGSGAAGSAGSSAPVCQFQCQVDDDCDLPTEDPKGVPLDSGLICRKGSCFGCNTTDDCVRIFSAWLKPCAGGDASCALNEVCIDVGHPTVGRCARRKGSCESAAPIVIPRKRLGPGDISVEVCSQNQVECHNELCQLRCTDNSGCSAELGSPICDINSQKCICGTDAECVGANYRGKKCVAGRCGCAVDADCAGAFTGDKCVDGYCSCSTASVCLSPTKPEFANAPVMCAQNQGAPF